MKVGIIGSKLNLWSGSSKPIFQMMNALEKKGVSTAMLSDSLSHSSTVFLSKPIEGIQNKLENKLKLTHLNVKRIEGNLLPNLLRKDKETKDVIHTFSKDCDLILCTDFMFAWLLRKNEIKLNKPLVYIASNNLDLSSKYLIDAGLLSFVNLAIPDYLLRLLIPKYLNKYFISRFDCIIATSRFVKGIFEKYKLNKPVYDLPIGINDTEVFNPVTDKNSHSFIHFGWGSNIRGLPDVVKAFEMYKSEGGIGKLKLYLSGLHGFEEIYLVKRIKKLNMQEAIGINYFSENIEENILSSSIVILPFRIPFGYSQPPLVVLESMALGRCVISTNIGSIPEYIKNGFNGFLVNKKSPEEISKVMLNLDIERINVIGYNAYRYIHDNYSWDIVINKYIERFENILKKSKEVRRH